MLYLHVISALEGTISDLILICSRSSKWDSDGIRYIRNTVYNPCGDYISLKSTGHM